MIGPGKYDPETTRIRRDTHAAGVLLVVFDGDRGNGFSAQLPLDLTLRIPEILRDIADQIEQSGPVKAI
jgi:hypothetical protein